MRMKGINFHELDTTPPAQSLNAVTSSHSDSQALVSPAIIQSEAVSISPVVLCPAATSAAADLANSSKRQKVEGTTEAPAAVPMAACYICRLTSVPGKFLPQKAKELGVRPGPLFGKLKAGIAVQGKDRLVHPEEVLEAAPAAPVVIIADCPTRSHLPSLLSSPAWAAFAAPSTPQSTTTPSSAPDPTLGSNPVQEHVNCIVHLAPPEVVETEQYQQWMAGFGNTVKHVHVNAKAVPETYPLPSPATLQMKLNCIDAKVFPLPHNITSAQLPGDQQQSTAQPQPASQLQATAQPQSTSQLAGSNRMKYNLRPAARVDIVEHVEQALSVSEVQAELRRGVRRFLSQSAVET
ncbi:hypothetical protein ABBQ38_009154 [Trebouxia sp. C0009 RCD-2024]